MAPFDDWNNDEEDDELEDNALLETKNNVTLYCVDCSESMFELRPDTVYEDRQTCHLQTVLEGIISVQRRKVTVNPNDSVGIMLYNVNKKPKEQKYSAELKKNCFVLQPLGPLNAPSIQELIQIAEEARDDPSILRDEYPPAQGPKTALAEVLTSCSWVIRDGAPKTAGKRIFLITDNDNPCHIDEATARELGLDRKRLENAEKQYQQAATTALSDLRNTGVGIEPFFISDEEKPFDSSIFYDRFIGQSSNPEDEDEVADDVSKLPANHFVNRIETLLSEMQSREIPKRALYNIPLELSDTLTIGVKGFGLITEQKKGSYKYFKDTGDRMAAVESKTSYENEHVRSEIERKDLFYGMGLGAEPPVPRDDDGSDGHSNEVIAQRVVNLGQRPYYTADEIKSFRTMGLEPGIKLLGFKDKKELAFEDNIKHSYFIYPDETTYAGSQRTFTALLRSIVKKNKIGITRVMMRRNTTPVFCALLAQPETFHEDGAQNDPPGFHLIALPFADDLRAAPIETAVRSEPHLKIAAREWMNKLIIKQGYIPDTYPNPALEYHNKQVEDAAFDEEFDASKLEDLTEPKVDIIDKKAGALITSWKSQLEADPNWNTVTLGAAAAKKKTAVKRKVVERDEDYDTTEVESRRENGTLRKMTVAQLKEFLKAVGVQPKGNKPDLLVLVEEFLDSKS